MTSAPHPLDALSPVAVGTSVLHIGPHKTGTSALQQALRQARTDLLAQGVRLAGPDAGDADGVRYAITGRPLGDEDAGRLAWERIKADLTDTSVARRIYSRENFANATTKRARIVLQDLGLGTLPIHVVVSARPLAELIPSQYSQLVQRGACTMSFDDWFPLVLERNTDEHSVRIFWKRHSLEEQVRRWGGLVGLENLTVVVVDRGDPQFLPKAFERLLDMRPGTLTEQMRQDWSNRSLTFAELELVRQWHEITAQAGAAHGDQVRLAWRLCYHLRKFNPQPTDPRPALPGPAVAKANELSAASAAEIAALGVRVVGDLDSLSAVPVRD